MQIHLTAEGLSTSIRASIASQVHTRFRKNVSLVTCDIEPSKSHVMFELEEGEAENCELIDSIINYSAETIEFYQSIY